MERGKKSKSKRRRLIKEKHAIIFEVIFCKIRSFSATDIEFYELLL